MTPTNEFKKYKCPICKQENLSAEEELKIIDECKKLLPDAIKNKTSDKVIGDIIGLKLPAKHFDISKNTLRRILIAHGCGFLFEKQPKLEKEAKKARYTEAEYQIVIDAYEKNNMRVVEIVSSKFLGDRTPSIATVNDILSRKSKVYQENNKNKSRIPEEKKIIIVDLFKQETPIKDIAAQLNYSRKAIEIILSRRGFDITQGKTDQEKLEIYHYYVGFKGTDATGETCKKFNTSPTRVRDIAIEVINRYDLLPDTLMPPTTRDNSESHREYTLTQSFFDTIDTGIKAHILGLIATDGNVHRNVIAIELKRSDKELLDRVSKEINSNKPGTNTIHFDKRYNHYTEGTKVAFISTKLTAALTKFGVVPNKSLTLKLNMESFSADICRHLWRGVIDGDGWVYCGERLQIGLCGSLEMMKDFVLYLEKNLGIKETIVKHHSIWKVVIDSEKESLNVLHHLYDDAPIYLRRKNLLLLPEAEFTNKILYQKVHGKI